MTTEPTDTRRVELRVRDDTPTSVLETADRIASRLRRLEDDGQIDEYALESWGCRQLRPAEAVEAPTAAVVEAYRSWADDAGHTLEPAFCRREVSSMVSETSYTKLVVPFLTIAVYDGEELECVAPCSNGAAVFTVDDCLAALEVGASDLVAESLESDSVGDVESAERHVHPA